MPFDEALLTPVKRGFDPSLLKPIGEETSDLLPAAERTADVAIAGKKSLDRSLYGRNIESVATALGQAEQAIEPLLPSNIAGTITGAVNIPSRIAGQPDLPPLLSQKDAEESLRRFFTGASQPSTQQDKFEQVQEGAIQGAAGLASGATSPETALGILAGVKYPDAVMSLFKADILSHMPEAVANVFKSKTPTEVAKNVVGALGQGAMLKALSLHAEAGPETPPFKGSSLDIPKGSVRGVGEENLGLERSTPEQQAAANVGPATAKVVEDIKPNETELHTETPIPDETQAALDGRETSVPINPPGTSPEGNGPAVETKGEEDVNATPTQQQQAGVRQQPESGVGGGQAEEAGVSDSLQRAETQQPHAGEQELDGNAQGEAPPEIAPEPTPSPEPTKTAEGVPAMTQTPDFQKWFEGSKVVDAEGNPIVVYHGTTGVFDTFDPNRQSKVMSIYGRGSYFSTTKEGGNAYAEGTGSVIPVYLSIKNPAPLDVVERAKYKYPSGGKELTDYLKSKGYDGVIGSHEIVAYYPEQIRSSIAPTPKPPEQTTLPAEGLPAGPGASRPEDVGSTKSDMVELTQALENSASPKKSITDRLNDAKDLVKSMPAEVWKSTKEGVRNGVERLSAIGSALKTGLTKLPEFTTFKKALGKWDGSDQIADHELRMFVKQINKNFPKDRQVAMTNWIQADGDPAILKQRAADSNTSALRKGYEDALTLTPDEITSARNISYYLDSRLQSGIESGILDHGLDNYITQVWKRPNLATNKLVSDMSVGKLQPNFKYSRQRMFESYFAGEQNGFEPANKSVGALIAAYDQSFNRALSARSFIKNLSGGKASDGRPLVEVSGSGRVVESGDGNPDAVLIKPKTKHDDIADYRNIDHPALRKWKWVGEHEGTPIMLEGNLLVHPEIYNHLKNVLSRSGWRTNPVGSAFLGVQRGIKELMFTASGFHQVQETLHALGHRINPANLDKIDFNVPLQKEAVEHGLQISSYNAMEQFSEGLGSGSVVSKIPLVGKRILGPYTEWLFQDYIPRLKMTMYQHALERNTERYQSDLSSGKITRDQVVENTAKQANAAFGELNYKWMGRNPTLQDSLRAFLIAPDFLEARGKFVGQALKPFGKEQLVALGVLAAVQYMTARTFNQMMDDDPHWNKPFSLIYKGHEYAMRTVPSDIAHLISDPHGFSVNRLSPSIRTAVEAITGRDFRGVKRDAMDQVKDFAKMGVPMSLRSRDDQRLWETFLNSIGVREAGYTASMEMRDLAKKFMEKTKGKPDVEIITSPDSPYRKLAMALQSGNESASKDALKNLETTKTRTQIIKTMQAHSTSGFVQKKDEEKFKASLDKSQLQKYQEAMVEKRETFDKFIKVLNK